MQTGEENPEENREEKLKKEKLQKEKLKKEKEILSQVISNLADDMQLNDYKLDKTVGPEIKH
jgi:hypothetical protein